MRAGLEKAKQALEKESADLSADLRSLASSKQDVEHKKKKLEGQLNELHSRFNESERQKTELSERISKMTVGHMICDVTTPAAETPTLVFCLRLCQVELDGVSSLLNEAEGKNIKLSKDMSTLNSQLQDAQARLENRSRTEIKPSASLTPPSSCCSCRSCCQRRLVRS